MSFRSRDIFLPRFLSLKDFLKVRFLLQDGGKGDYSLGQDDALLKDGSGIKDRLQILLKDLYYISGLSFHIYTRENLFIK